MGFISGIADALFGPDQPSGNRDGHDTSVDDDLPPSHDKTPYDDDGNPGIVDRIFGGYRNKDDEDAR